MYKFGWLRWRKWASSKNGKPVNLAKPLYIALFINELTNICVEKFMGVSPIELTLYGGSYYGRDGILPHWSSTREIICRSSEKEGGSLYHSGGGRAVQRHSLSHCVAMKIISEAKLPINQKSSMVQRVTRHLRLLRQLKCLTASKTPTVLD